MKSLGPVVLSCAGSSNSLWKNPYVADQTDEASNLIDVSEPKHDAATLEALHRDLKLVDKAKQKKHVEGIIAKGVLPAGYQHMLPPGYRSEASLIHLFPADSHRADDRVDPADDRADVRVPPQEIPPPAPPWKGRHQDTPPPPPPKKGPDTCNTSPSKKHKAPPEQPPTWPAPPPRRPVLATTFNTCD